MAILKYTVVDISTQLNDQENGFEYTRWTRPTLIGYVSDALAQIGLYRPDAFTTIQTVTLVPGQQQTLPDGIVTLSSILSNNSPDNPLAVMRDDLNLLRSFSKKTCNQALDKDGNVVYTLSGYFYDVRNPKYFFVSPPVPQGMNVAPTIEISGTISPPILTMADWFKDLPVDNKYYNAVTSWALSKAYEVDTESETSFRNMNYHRGEFYKMMGIKYNQESKYNSGWYLGIRGYESNVRGQQ